MRRHTRTRAVGQAGVRLRGASSLVLVFLLALACGGAATTGATGPGGATARDREIRHEACEIDSRAAESLDANADNRPDVTVVKEGGREICRAADLDFDGRIDVWSYRDGSGAVRRRELDYDRDGSVDEIQILSGGVMLEKHRSTTLARRLDTWETYVSGRLARAERDSDGDGRVDQWWDYASPDCPTIRTDEDRNGAPDPKAIVNYCEETGYKPPEQAETRPAETMRKELEGIPTETESESEQSAGAAADTKPAEATPTGKPGSGPAAAPKGQP